MADDSDFLRYSFRAWLLAQSGREDEIGSTARWLEADPGHDDAEGQGPLALHDYIERAARARGDVQLMAGAAGALEEWSRFVRGQAD